MIILPWQTQFFSSKPILNVIPIANTHLSQTFLQRNISVIITSKTYIACIHWILVGWNSTSRLYLAHDGIKTTKEHLRNNFWRYQLLKIVHEPASKLCWSWQHKPWAVLVPVFVPKPSCQIFLVVLPGSWRIVSTLPRLLKTEAVQTQSVIITKLLSIKWHRKCGSPYSWHSFVFSSTLNTWS